MRMGNGVFAHRRPALLDAIGQGLRRQAEAR
jgi:uncharacterized membrane protein YGL010W